MSTENNVKADSGFQVWKDKGPGWWRCRACRRCVEEPIGGFWQASDVVKRKTDLLGVHGSQPFLCVLKAA